MISCTRHVDVSMCRRRNVCVILPLPSNRSIMGILVRTVCCSAVYPCTTTMRLQIASIWDVKTVDTLLLQCHSLRNLACCSVDNIQVGVTTSRSSGSLTSTLESAANSSIMWYMSFHMCTCHRFYHITLACGVVGLQRSSKRRIAHRY